MTPSQTVGSVHARRAETDALVCGMPGLRDRGMAFDEPWQIRAFALALGAHKSGEFEWSEFQGALIDSIKDWESRNHDGSAAGDTWSYYEHWVEALEDVLGRSGSMDTSELDSKTREVLAVPANRGHHKAHLAPIAISPPLSA